MATDSYPPIIGGATRTTQLLARALAAHGHAVAVATPWQPGMEPTESDNGVDVVRLRGWSARLGRMAADPRRRHLPPVPDPGTVAGLVREIRSFHPDLLHSYGWITYSCLAALRGNDIPLLVSMQDYCNICAIRTLVRHTAGGQELCSGPRLGKCLGCSTRYYGSPVKSVVSVGGVLGGRRPLVRRMDGLHANSTYMHDTIERHLLAPAHSVVPTIVTIPNFRDDERDEPPQEHILARLPDKPFILFVGALRPIKGVGVLLEAYRQLESPPPLVFIGTEQPDTPEFPRDVVVLRDVPHGTVMAAWGRCLFGVAPSTWPEPQGIVVHEAMSRGKAVIGTSPSGMSDMIEHEVSGLLVSAGSVSALATAMDRLIRDVPLRERLGSAAREKSADFTFERVMPRFERLYEEMIAVSRRTELRLDG